MIKSGKVHELSAAKGQRKTGGGITKKNNCERRREMTEKTRTGKADSCRRVKARGFIGFQSDAEPEFSRLPLSLGE